MSKEIVHKAEEICGLPVCALPSGADIVLFCKAICNDPGNRFPRLILAEYLEERGDDVYELIMLAARVEELEERARELRRKLELPEPVPHVHLPENADMHLHYGEHEMRYLYVSDLITDIGFVPADDRVLIEFRWRWNDARLRNRQTARNTLAATRGPGRTAE